MMNPYNDESIVIDNAGITIRSYAYPGHERQIPFTTIEGFESLTLGRWSGQFRLVGFGFRRPRHFFHWSRHRRGRSQAIALDVGKTVRPVISPADHAHVAQLLEEHTL